MGNRRLNVSQLKALRDVVLVIFLISYIFSPYVVLGGEDSLGIVKRGKAVSIIVNHSDKFYPQMLDFQNSVYDATNIKLPIISVDSLRHYPSKWTRVIIGDSEYTQNAINLNVSLLKEEAFRVLTVGQNIVLTGNSDIKTTSWAVTFFLENYLGVRWLWPGKLGTYTPKQTEIIVGQIDTIIRPSLELRSLRISKLAPVEGKEWLQRHRMGNRSTYGFGHAFTKWYERYGKEYPDYFAIPLKGEKQEISSRVKLNVSNERIDSLIIQEWKTAGSPINWNVSPNDGIGFCVCNECVLMDSVQHNSLLDVWRGHANLTGRYVRFWNRLLKKMRPIEPNVTLSTYAYSAYRTPPPSDFKFEEDGMVIGFVHTYNAYKEWKGWSDAGAKLILRPNWWHSGVMAPHLLLHKTGEYFKFGVENNMIGFDFDSIMGYWGTQGLNYYLIARLSVNPDLSVDDVINEYTSAFGSARDIVKEYFQYWEEFSERAAYPVSAGHGVSMDSTGMYETLVKKYDLPFNPLGGSWYIMPFLYTEDVISEAKNILQRAEQQASDDSQEVKERIRFLADGLEHIELTSNVVRYGYGKSRPKGATKEDFIKLSNELDRFRKEKSSNHVLWYDAVESSEKRRKIPTKIDRTSGWENSQEETTKEIDERFMGL